MINKETNSHESEISRGQQLLEKSVILREQGDFEGSLDANESAFDVFVEEENAPKISEALSGMGLTNRHLFESTNKRDYGILARNYHTDALEILRQNGINEQYKALYELGKMDQSLGDNEMAIENIQAAIENFEKYPGQYPFGESVKAEMQTRLYALLHKKGENDAMAHYEEALERLRSAENNDEYTKNVWVSGAYMHMAEVLIGNDNDKARDLLEKAKERLDDQEKYKVRLGQIDKLFIRLSN